MVHRLLGLRSSQMRTDWRMHAFGASIGWHEQKRRREIEILTDIYVLVYAVGRILGLEIVRGRTHLALVILRLPVSIYNKFTIDFSVTSWGNSCWLFCVSFSSLLLRRLSLYRGGCAGPSFFTDQGRNILLQFRRCGSRRRKHLVVEVFSSLIVL